MRKRLIAAIVGGVVIVAALGNRGHGAMPPTPGTTPTVVAQATNAVPSPSVTDPPNAMPTPTRVPPTPTRVPPTPTPAKLKAQYRGDVDVRELYKNIDRYYDWKLRYTGTVLTIMSDSSGTLVQVRVPYGGDLLDYKVIDVIYDSTVDTSGIYEDSKVTIWGRPIKMFTITNAYGGQVDQPLLAGDFIERVP